MSVVKRRKGYTYDLYTAFKHTCHGRVKKLAVGMTEGLVHLDEGSSIYKSMRERHHLGCVRSGFVGRRSVDLERR